MQSFRKVSKLVNSGRLNAGYLLVFRETIAASNLAIGMEVINEQTVEEDGSITIHLTPYGNGNRTGSASRSQSRRAATDNVIRGRRVRAAADA
jgi:hypothetical protein